MPLDLSEAVWRYLVSAPDPQEVMVVEGRVAKQQHDIEFITRASAIRKVGTCSYGYSTMTRRRSGHLFC